MRSQPFKRDRNSPEAQSQLGRGLRSQPFKRDRSVSQTTLQKRNHLV
ncbi:MAG: hypothetical protein AAGF01_26980 [Cyanobacteria bacterium P01_G01_bin.38]